MGIYSTKLLEGAVSPDDVIQTPDDVGNDLDQIEKAVMDSHDEEVEAAEEGLIGDPIEESAMILYESEYNYNQILNAIGIHELREASMGRDVIYEAVDIKGFFGKVKDIIKKMFQKITEAVSKVIAALDFQLKIDKKYASEHEKDIKAGWNKVKDDSKWKFKGYKFSDTKVNDELGKMEDTIKKTTEEAKKYITDIASGKATVDSAEEAVANISKAKILEKLGAKDLKEYSEKYKIELYGSEKPLDDVKSEISVDGIIALLKADRETAAIKTAYNKTKDAYKNALKSIDEVEKKLTASEGHYTAAMSYAERYAATVKFGRDIANATFTAGMAVARAKRAQARKFAHALVAAAKKKETKDAGSEPTHESGSIFGGIKLA